MKIRTIHEELWLPQPREVIFPFFADARNLEELTPPWLRFQVRTPMPVEMRVGLILDYRILMRGIPLKWRSEITVWEPGVRFVDEQRKGPYLMWKHEHRFHEEKGGVLVVDHVEYAVFMDALVHPILVAPDLRRIFDFRHEKLRERFLSH